MNKYSYDTDQYDFAKLIKEVLSYENLEKVHTITPEDVEYNEVFNIDNDNETWFHKKFYNKLNRGWPEFIGLYKKFIKEQIAKHFDTKLVYQARPTFRVHLPENVAVGANELKEDGFHKDSDEGYGHPRDEISVYLPLTDAYDTNTIWAESVEDKKDYSAMNAKYGEYYIWKGSCLSHGNKLNDTKKSRVSFDFRIIPKSQYRPEHYKSSRNQKKKFEVGDYYEEI